MTQNKNYLLYWLAGAKGVIIQIHNYPLITHDPIINNPLPILYQRVSLFNKYTYLKYTAPSVMYWSCFIDPWTKYRQPETFPDITDYTITEVGCLTVQNRAPQLQSFVFMSSHKLRFFLQTNEC